MTDVIDQLSYGTLLFQVVKKIRKKALSIKAKPGNTNNNFLYYGQNRR